MKKQVLIIGCGISGASLARRLADNGWHVDIYEKEDHIGGNCFDSKNKKGILIHNFGPHIFHTSNEEVYKFISKFTKLNGYVNKVFVSVKNKFFPLPINFNSIKIIMKNKAEKIIHVLKNHFPDSKTVTIFQLKKIKDKNVKEFLNWITKNVYVNYSTKMWGVKFSEIDPKTINRIKIVLSYEHNYFPDDKYQGLPVGGYTKFITKMINHPNIKIHLNQDGIKYLSFKKNILWRNKKVTSPIIFCGPLDEILNYKYGKLPYRSLNFKFKTFHKKNFQLAAVINYPAHPTITRITEYKFMTKQKQANHTTISLEYPGKFDLSSKKFNQRLYPILNKENIAIYKKYLCFFKKYKNFYCLGRLSQYRYFDMDDAIFEALRLAKELQNA